MPEVPAVEFTAPATEPVAAVEQPSPAASTETPPWGDDFNPDKAWNLIQNLRSDKEKLSAREILTPEQKSRLAEYDKVVEANKSELEKAQDAADRASQQLSAVTNRAVQAEVKALAADKFADPSDAAAFLETAKYAKPDGDIDVESIAADLADLLARKPHLGKQVDPRAPAPNPAQGTSAGGPTTTPQMSRADVERLSREGKYAEIDQAREDGRLNTLLGIK